MKKYIVERRCFYNGRLYLKGQTLELPDDEMLVHNYRTMGYIGAEIPPVTRKGRKVKKTVNAKIKKVRNALSTQ